MPSPEVSPITLEPVPFDPHFVTGRGCWFYHSRVDDFADLGLSEGAAMRLRGRDMYTTDWSRYATREQTRAALDLLRSYLWRVQREVAPPFMVVTEDAIDNLDHLKRSGFNLIPFESLLAEADKLEFDDKAEQTLANLVLEYNKKRQPIHFTYAYFPSDAYGPGNIVKKFAFMDKAEAKETGICYGCDKHFAALVLQFLQDEGLIAPEESKSPRGIVVTPKGMSRASSIKKQQQVSLNDAFFIRSYDTSMDEFFEVVMTEVFRKTGVAVKPVWGEKHNDRIDSRIFEKLSSSGFVVLDVTQRFNVGLEAGWALREGKTIIAIRRKPVPYQSLPFDIATLNTFDYEIEQPGELIDDLVARINVAKQKLTYKSIQ